MKSLPWFVYILQCHDGSFYTGITNNLKNRVEEHNVGEGAKYTRTRRPVILVYKEEAKDESMARKRELELKGWPREKKEKLVAGFLPPLKAVSG